MLRKSLVLKLFEGFTMQRWNDQLRCVDFVEIDNQAHAMSLSYFLARAVSQDEDINMIALIEKGIFKYFERIIVTDIKPQIFLRIEEDTERYTALKAFVKKSMLPYLEGLPEDFIQRFCDWCDETGTKQTHSVLDKVMSIARADARLWEFKILHHLNPDGYGMQMLSSDMDNLKNKHREFRQLLSSRIETRHIREESKTELFADESHSSYQQLSKMFGQMRFQVRWSQLNRQPKTSVLGHAFYVAILSYLFSLSVKACDKRKYNNFFTGLFHDLPEVFTRDIISPLKMNIPGLGDLISEIEKEEIDTKFRSLVPVFVYDEIFYFINDEFSDLTQKDGEILVHKEGINSLFNTDEYNPKDGSIVRLADHLSVFVEAEVAINNGATAFDFSQVKDRVSKLYAQKIVAGMDLTSLFLDFR